jgi:sporulation protein YlmC with PRC-barrel domain
MQQTIADIKRYPVYNTRGEKLGVIDDIILDADDWKVCYAVLQYEVPGQPQKLLGVTLDALTLDSENECLVVAADDEALHHATGLSKDAPPREPEPLFRSMSR